MKKIMKMVALLGLSAFLFTSCSNDDGGGETGTQPTADFAFKMKSDLTVTFTNNSEDGEEYLWDFGDGNTSAEESPSHKYATKGSYSVTLTVTNGSFTDEMTKTVDLNNAPVVDIDGAFTDWANVTGFTLSDTVKSMYGVTKVKMTSDANYIYFYAELVKDVAGHLSLYFRMSATPNTYQPWMWGNKDVDCLAQFTDINSAEWVPESGDVALNGYDKPWGSTWPASIDIVPAGSQLWSVSGIKDLATKATFDGTQYDVVAIEIAMQKNILPDAYQPGATMGIGFYMQAVDWADAGALPVANSAAANHMYTYTFATKALTW